MRKTAITFAAVLGCGLLLTGCDQPPTQAMASGGQYNESSAQGGGGNRWFWFMNERHAPPRYIQRGNRGHWDREVRR